MKADRTTRHFKPRQLIYVVSFGIILFALLSLVLTAQLLPSRYDLKEGDVCTIDIRSPQRVTYVSAERTDEEREKAASSVPDIYVHDTNLGTQQQQKLKAALLSIDEIRLQQQRSFSEKREAIGRVPGLSLSPDALTEITNMLGAEWSTAGTEAQRLLEIVMRSKIGQSDLADTKAKLSTLLSPQLPIGLSTVTTELVASFIAPNFLLDTEATDRVRQAARDGVQPVKITIEKGEMILRDGDIVRQVHLEQLEAAGLRNPTIDWGSFSGIALLVTVLVAVLCVYLYLYRPGLALDARRLGLLLLVILTAVVAAKLVVPGRELYGYLFPVAAVSMLVSALLDSELALIPSTVVAILVGTISDSSLEFATLGIVGSVVGMLGLRRVERLNSFFVTGGAIALANVFVVFGFHLSNGETDIGRLAWLAFVSIVNGGLCAALALGTFTVLGHAFGITTSLGLLELAHPTQRLFRRLLTEAPGTYHHSVLVANLSERAAQAVGADALLARVGAYYHDIGKVSHPYFFIENQLNGSNVHDLMDARASVQAIAAHVTDGVDLARRNRLPGKVIDIIRQHHGTSLVRYFYHQACQEEKGEVSPAEFSYPGPKPQTREAGIVMLADSVEAMVRASQDKSAEHIESLVNKAISDRLTEGQLDECDITMRDLDNIKRAFVSVLQGIFHPRITYPEDIKMPRSGSGQSPNSDPSSTARKSS